MTAETSNRKPAGVDTDLWRCTVCGQVGTVGRCCGEETREPLGVKGDTFAAPPPAAARGDVRYDRELIAQMLDVCGHPKYTLDAYREQARLLREADNAGAEKVGTARALTAAQQQGLRIVEPIRNCATPESREAAMVVLETDAEGNPTIWCDPEIADLVRALNVGGVRTKASCSGHGEKPFGIVSLQDGRELLVLPDWETTRRAERILDAALSAQQSPAEAQPVAKLVNRKDADGGKTTTFIRPTSLGMDLPLGEYPLHLHPSAPVGVEELTGLLERIRDLLASLPADCLGSGTDASGQPYPIRDEVIHGITKALAQQPAAVGEEIMVNAAHDVYTLPLQPSGLSSGPRFVVHVPAPEQQPAAVDRARFRKAPCYLCGYNGAGYFQPETHPCAALYHAAQPGGAE